MKLAIIWDTTQKGTLKNLMLVCPKGDGNPNTETGQAHWQIEIPHPAMSVKAMSTADSSTEDLELELPSVPHKTASANGND